MTPTSDLESTNPTERRCARRLTIRLPVECQRDDGGARYVVRTVTRNVSSGGLYFELDNADLRPRDRLHVELTLPPAEGVSPYEGRASCEAEVLRVLPTSSTEEQDAVPRYGVAAQFRERLRFSY